MFHSQRINLAYCLWNPSVNNTGIASMPALCCMPLQVPVQPRNNVGLTSNRSPQMYDMGRKPYVLFLGNYRCAHYRHNATCCYAFHLPRMPAPARQCRWPGMLCTFVANRRWPTENFRCFGFSPAIFKTLPAFTHATACTVADKKGKLWELYRMVTCARNRKPEQ